MNQGLFLSALFCLTASTAVAQDPVKADPSHYKVEFENAQVRVLRVHHDPHDRSPMHEHPAGVVVWLTDGHERLTLPDGKTQESRSKSGQVGWTAGTRHAVENLSDNPFEVILVELKAKPTAATPARRSSRLALLVFKDSSIAAVTDYWLEEGRLHYITSGTRETAVPLERVDLEMTAQLNWERGAKFALHPKPSAR